MTDQKWNANEPSNDDVICPNCAAQFRAIPVNIQTALRACGFAEPFMEFAVTVDESQSVADAATKLRDECHSAAFNAGWWNVPFACLVDPNEKIDVRKYPSHILQWWIGTKLALIHSEISEALEGLRKDKFDDHLPHLKSIDVELADAVIRIMDLCGGLNIDIGRAIAEKLAYNAQRADHKPENRDKAGGKAF